MSNASAAIASARVYLGDINGISWNDAVLMPILQEAFGELQLELGVHRNSVIKAQTVQFVPANTILFPNLPPSITSPISMYERDPGDDNDSWEEMQKVTFLPNQDPDVDLEYWCWIAQTITFIGATSNREVQLKYNGYLTAPNTLNDPLGFIWAERFLGPRIASIALSSIGQEKRAVYADGIAAKNLYEVMQYNVTQDQRPFRRKKYRSFKGSFNLGEGQSVPVGPIPEISAPPVFLAPSSISGVSINFTSPILFLNMNGNMLFPNVGYKGIGGTSYALIDTFGNEFSPPAGAIIMGQIS